VARQPGERVMKIPTKSEQAYEILKSSIANGTFTPGHRLVIDQLGREHGISSVPWREALRRLEAEGWVAIVPNSGAVVRRFGRGEWMRTIRLLARLEGLATALSSEHLTSHDLSHAEDLNAQMAQALADFDLQRFGRLNHEFHDVLCSRCDDEHLLGLVRSEWMRMDLIRRSVYWHAPGRAKESVAEHAALLGLIRAGARGDDLETAARRHELNTLEAVAAYDAAEAAR